MFGIVIVMIVLRYIMYVTGPGLATIVGTLTLLKIKAIFVTLIVLAIAAVFSRFLGMGCGAGGDLMGLGCTGTLLTPTAHAGSAPTYGQYDQYGGTGGSGYSTYYNHRSAKSVQGSVALSLSTIIILFAVKNYEEYSFNLILGISTLAFITVTLIAHHCLSTPQAEGTG